MTDAEGAIVALELEAPTAEAPALSPSQLAGEPTGVKRHAPDYESAPDGERDAKQARLDDGQDEGAAPAAAAAVAEAEPADMELPSALAELLPDVVDLPGTEAPVSQVELEPAAEAAEQQPGALLEQPQQEQQPLATDAVDLPLPASEILAEPSALGDAAAAQAAQLASTVPPVEAAVEAPSAVDAAGAAAEAALPAAAAGEVITAPLSDLAGASAEPQAAELQADAAQLPNGMAEALQGLVSAVSAAAAAGAPAADDAAAAAQLDVPPEIPAPPVLAPPEPGRTDDAGGWDRERSNERGDYDRDRGGGFDRGGGGGRGGGRAAVYVEAHLPGQEPRGDPVKLRLPPDAVIKQEIPLPRRMASVVIGLRGQAVSRLRRECNVRIHVRPSTTPAELDQVVEIEGTLDTVGACVRAIDAMLHADDPSFRMQPKPEAHSKFFVLPEWIAPAVVGKNGTHTRHVRERTGTRVDVLPLMPGNNRQEVQLRGHPEGVRDAYHIMLGNLRQFAPALPPGAVPAPLPVSQRAPPPPPSMRAGGGAADAAGWRGRPGSASGSMRPMERHGMGGPPPPMARSMGGSGQPPPPPRSGAGEYGYDGYGAPRGGDPYHNPAPEPYVPTGGYGTVPPTQQQPVSYQQQQPPPQQQLHQQPALGGYVTAAQPVAGGGYATMAPADGGLAAAPAAATAAAAPAQQMMYILQDGVLKPLTVMYQQQGGTADGAASAAPAPQQTGYAAPAATAATYGAAPTAQTAAPTYATYMPAGGATDGSAAQVVGTSWAGAVQGVAGSAQTMVAAAPMSVSGATYASAAPAGVTYVQAGGQQYATLPSGTTTQQPGVQYVQYTYQQQ